MAWERRLSAEFACGKAEGRFDHSERLHDADDTCSRDASDTDVAGVVLEYLVRRHFADGHCYACVHKVDDLSAPDEVHKRDDDEPYEEASAADDECVLESDDISQSEDGGTCAFMASCTWWFTM